MSKWQNQSTEYQNELARLFFFGCYTTKLSGTVDAHITKSNCLEVKRDDISFFFLHASPKLYTENLYAVFLQIEMSNSNQMLCNTNSRQESLIHIKRMSCEMSNNTQRIILENDVVPTEYKRMPNSNPLLMKKN
jgi:hypothetical protein